MTLAISDRLARILRDPITLEALDGDQAAAAGFLDYSFRPTSSKNSGELAFARDDYTEPDGRNYVERLVHMPHPTLRETDVVLDVGCGPRGFLDGLAGEHVFLDDLLGAYVKDLGATYEGLPISCGTELMPFADDSIDVVYSVNMIDHVEDMAQTMCELARVLKPDGVIVLQTYFNSHPLLATEPGVFDRYFWDTEVLTRFDPSFVQSHCVESPTVDRYYTMGILTCHLRLRQDCELPELNRDVYAQKLCHLAVVSDVLEAVSNGEIERADKRLEDLDRSGLLEFHGHLLEAAVRIAQGDLHLGVEALATAKAHPRAHRNPYARLALMELDAKRLNAAIVRSEQRNSEVVAAAEAKTGRIKDLIAAVDLKDSRVAEVAKAISQRDVRIAELDAAVAGRDVRIAELDAAVAGRDAELAPSADAEG